MDPEQRLSYIIERIQNLSRSDLKIMLRGVASILANEPALVRITEGPVVFVGDLHGDWGCSQKAYLYFLANHCKRLVFLGDFIDRGTHQIDNVNFLLYLKLLHRYKVYLIRGNHEIEAINRGYGFHEAVSWRFGKETKSIYDLYNYVFTHLPLAGVTWNKYFFAHGGIPEQLNMIDDLESGILSDEEYDEIAYGLLWNDPSEKKEGFSKNRGRGGSVQTFGKNVFESFLERNALQGMIRSHEHYKNGYKYYFDEKLVAIFSSRAYSKKHNPKMAFLTKQGDLEIRDL